MLPNLEESINTIEELEKRYQGFQHLLNEIKTTGLISRKDVASLEDIDICFNFVRTKVF